MEEISFFDSRNVSVSSARFIVSGQTYAMSGVTSVKTGRKDPSRMGPIILVLIGVCAMLAGTMEPVLVGLVLVGLGVYWFTQQKPELSVVLNSASGEAQALTSTDADFINGVITALNNAIVHRG